MAFNISAALLDAIVLSVVSKDKDGTYGYKITQDIREFIEVSESTLYPVLRRLQKEHFLEIEDKQFDGRNRRYYKLTDTGKDKLLVYQQEWKKYVSNINILLFGEVA